MRFADQVAIVTGAASGIGLATSVRLAAEGARVVMVDRDAGKLREATARLPNGQASSELVDLADAESAARVVERTMASAGRLDVLVNNAATMKPAPLDQLTIGDWNRVLAVNLLAPFALIRAAFGAMSNGGAIVNVASVHAFVAQAGAGAYAASKAALLSLTRTAALEGRARGIRVNAVVPGAVNTPMLWENPAVKSGAEKIDPADVGEPEDLAAAIVFLASAEARFICGTALAVDGGRLTRL